MTAVKGGMRIQPFCNFDAPLRQAVDAEKIVNGYPSASVDIGREFSIRYIPGFMLIDDKTVPGDSFAHETYFRMRT